MQEALVLVRLQAVLGDELRGDLDVVRNHGLRVPDGPAIGVGRGIACLGPRDNIPRRRRRFQLWMATNAALSGAGIGTGFWLARST
ncbi:hypothetical protein OCUBac02_12480 [Bosea sp. ANAM02]|nr:hypothetical protein OCUBac02_12480 [Bosea sp. ANAM02]